MAATLGRHRLTLAGSGVALVLVLAGCTTGSGPTSGTAAPTSSTSSSPGVTEASSPSPDDTSSPGGNATPSPSATHPLASSAARSASPSRCTAANLVASLAPGDGGAAGSVLPYLVLTNTGAAVCELQGWPGVSFVGNGTGVQLGAAGDFDRSSPHGTVTLEPGGAAHAPLRIAQAGNYEAATCDPQLADGLRVYPPGETHSLFVATTDLTACRDGAIHLITVQALAPGAS